MGATLAANYRQSEFVPRIIELLSIPNRYLPYYALDALIRMNADVPDALLLPLADKYFEQVIILLARDRVEHGEALLRLLDREKNDFEWLVLNSIIADHPPPGYVERLWHEWTLRSNLYVTDPGSGAGGGGGGQWADGVREQAPLAFRQPHTITLGMHCCLRPLYWLGDRIPCPIQRPKRSRGTTSTCREMSTV